MSCHGSDHLHDDELTSKPYSRITDLVEICSQKFMYCICYVYIITSQDLPPPPGRRFRYLLSLEIAAKLDQTVNHEQGTSIVDDGLMEIAAINIDR